MISKNAIGKHTALSTAIWQLSIASSIVGTRAELKHPTCLIASIHMLAFMSQNAETDLRSAVRGKPGITPVHACQDQTELRVAPLVLSETHQLTLIVWLCESLPGPVAGRQTDLNVCFCSAKEAALFLKQNVTKEVWRCHATIHKDDTDVAEMVSLMERHDFRVNSDIYRDVLRLWPLFSSLSISDLSSVLGVCIPSLAGGVCVCSSALVVLMGCFMAGCQ